MTLIDKLAWIEIVERQILVTLSRGKDKYYIPGGKREKDESDHQALSREILEELNVKLIPNTIEFIGTFESQAHDKPDGVVVRMACYSGKYDGTLRASSEIEEIRWFKHRDRFQCSKVDTIILDWLRNKDLID